jgi:hypothetical protein
MKKLIKINLICTVLALALMGAYSFSSEQEMDVAYLPNPEDCTTFYVAQIYTEHRPCDITCPPGCWGPHFVVHFYYKVLMECPPGLHWNASMLICDWQENCWKCG